jgi:hypothetical protein
MYFTAPNQLCLLLLVVVLLLVHVVDPGALPPLFFFRLVVELLLLVDPGSPLYVAGAHVGASGGVGSAPSIPPGCGAGLLRLVPRAQGILRPLSLLLLLERLLLAPGAQGPPPLFLHLVVALLLLDRGAQGMLRSSLGPAFEPVNGGLPSGRHHHHEYDGRGDPGAPSPSTRYFLDLVRLHPCCIVPPTSVFKASPGTAYRIARIMLCGNKLFADCRFYHYCNFIFIIYLFTFCVPPQSTTKTILKPIRQPIILLR